MEKIKRKSFYVVLFALAFVFAGLFYMEIKADEPLKIYLLGNNYKGDHNITVSKNATSVQIEGIVDGMLNPDYDYFVIWSYYSNISYFEKKDDYINQHNIAKADEGGLFTGSIPFSQSINYGENKKIYLYVWTTAGPVEEYNYEITLGLEPEIRLDSYDGYHDNTYVYSNFNLNYFINDEYNNRKYYIKGSVSNPNLMKDCLYWDYGTASDLGDSSPNSDHKFKINYDNKFTADDAAYNYVELKEITPEPVPFVVYYTNGGETVPYEFNIQIPADKIAHIGKPKDINIVNGVYPRSIYSEDTTTIEFEISEPSRKDFSDGYNIVYRVPGDDTYYQAATSSGSVVIGPDNNKKIVELLEQNDALDVQFYLEKKHNSESFVLGDPVTIRFSESKSILVWEEGVASNNTITLPKYDKINGTISSAKIKGDALNAAFRTVDYQVIMSSIEYDEEELVEKFDNNELTDELVFDTKMNPLTTTKANFSIEYGQLPRVTGDYYFYVLMRKRKLLSDNWVTSFKGNLGKWTFNVETPQNEWTQLQEVIYKFDDTYKAFVYDDSIEIKGKVSKAYNEDEVIWTETDYSKVDDPDALTNWVASEEDNFTNIVWNEEDNTRTYDYTCSLSNFGFDDNNVSKTIYFYDRRKVKDGEYISYYLGSIVFEEDKKPTFNYKSISYKWEGNDYISLKVQDTQTGLKKIEVYGDDVLLDSREWSVCDTSEQDLHFTDNLGHDKNVRRNYLVKIYDWTGRENVYSDFLQNSPEISVEPANKLETLGKEDYFYAATRDTVINVDVLKNKKDAEDPLTKYLTNVEVIVNGVTVENVSLDEEDLVTEYKYDLNLSNTSIPEAADKKYNITVKASNECGCYSDDSIAVEIDDKKPVIGKIMFGETAADLSKLSNKGTDYVFFSNASVNSKFDVSDIDSTGLKNSKYYWLDSNNKTVGEKVNTYDPYKAQNIETVTRDGSYKSFLYLSTEDAVGNFAYSDGGAEQYVTPGGIIIDLPDNHNKENHLSLSVPTSTQKDEKGNPLFNSSVTIGVEAIDTFAGIRSVEWNVSLPNDSSKNSSGSLTIDNTGKLSDGTWRKDGSEANLVTKVKKDITISGNSNNIVLYVKVTDNAGNVSDASTTISIDTVSPKVSIAFNDVKGDATYTNYYNQARTATITVQERNFDASSANAIITNSIGNTGTLSQWSKSEDTKNPDNTTYTAKVTFDKDDTYNLSLKCGDTAGNGSETVTVQEFVIDTVKPEMTLTFLNDNGKNGYHSAARVATLFVKELNFDADRIHVEGNTIEAAVTVSAWTKTAQGYTATVSFAKDGIYDIKINGTDKAGNVADTVAIPSFTIDMIDPEITVEGLNNKTSNNGKVAPVITFKDINIDKSTIKIELSGLKNGKMDIEDWYTVSDDGLIYTFKNIANKKELDDLYTMKITSADKSGNVSTQTLTFSVNRFGSIYVFGDELKKINNKYVKKVSGLELTEINVDELDQKTIELTLTINGVPKTLKSGTDYKIQLVSDDAEWKNYRYVLSDSLFKEDGSYILTVYSKDKAGNENENVDADKDSEIKFGIDATAPIVAGINVESNHFYDTNGMVAIISVKDNMILENVEILVDGKPVEFTNEDEMYSFDLPESNMRQAIEIRAKDSAGNLTVERIDGVLVSGNFFIKFMHNKIAIAGTVLGGAALALAGILFMIFKKK